MPRSMFALPVILILATLPGVSQNYHRPPDFHDGLRQGGRGGQYYNPRHGSDGYDQRYQQDYGYQRRYDDPRQHQGGIGPGKGALIGGAGGAVLGALFGGGLKGTIIGGAAGAGIGAIVGQVHQKNQRRQYYYPR